MQKIFLVFLCCLSLGSFAQSITDSIGALHYKINVTNITYGNSRIKAKTTVTIKSKKANITSIPLSLLGLVVDSVKVQGQKVIHSYISPNLRIPLLTPLNQDEQVDIDVYYRGQPKKDPTFGGFIFSGSYAFNLGVGFDADPHNFGKVWYPCIDEFTDRATYEFVITAPFAYKAFCNGILQSSSYNAGTGEYTWYWKMDQPIPTYLASVAVAPFYTMKKSYKGIPIEWGIMSGDSIKTKTTFAKIDTAMSAFIKAYGPYPFDKVGFISVPFNGGAMEHASSIHIGLPFVDGTLTYETLWAHELSHMWWGDKVTCKTAGDMWLNEGFASFNEYLFTEAAYGKAKYKNEIRKLHREVVQFAHVKDNGYLSLKDVPHAYTYGPTVYRKGADMVHTLRNYLGDDLFFEGCKTFLNSFSFGNADSYDLSSSLTSSSSINTTRFFDDWIFTPGFPHFSIDSTLITPNGGSFSVKVYTRQRQKGNTHVYKMPTEVFFSDGARDTVLSLTIDALTNEFTFSLPFNPSWIALDRNEKISDAIVDLEKSISSSGVQDFPETYVSLDVQNSGADTSIIRIEHNYVKPDGFKSPSNDRLSDYHYWKVDGVFSTGFQSKATFSYDGSASTTKGYLDNVLIRGPEDSLIILYRASVKDDWTQVRGFTLNKMGSATDKQGQITIPNLLKGEYTLAIGEKDNSNGGIIIGTDTICTGMNAELILSGYVGNIIDWEFADNNITGPWTSIGNINDTLTISSPVSGRWYRAIVKNGTWPSITSTEMQIVISANSNAGVIKGNDPVFSGVNSSTLSLDGRVGNVIDWEYSVLSVNGPWISTGDSSSQFQVDNLNEARWYRAIVNNGACSSDTTAPAKIEVLHVDAINQVKIEKKFKIYPNPIQGKDGKILMIDFENSIKNKTSVIKIHDIQGRLVQEEKFFEAGSTFYVNVSKLSTGTYSVSLESNGKLIGEQKLIVKN